MGKLYARHKETGLLYILFPKDNGLFLLVPKNPGPATTTYISKDDFKRLFSEVSNTPLREYTDVELQRCWCSSRSQNGVGKSQTVGG